MHASDLVVFTIEKRSAANEPYRSLTKSLRPEARRRGKGSRQPPLAKSWPARFSSSGSERVTRKEIELARERASPRTRRRNRREEDAAPSRGVGQSGEVEVEEVEKVETLRGTDNYTPRRRIFPWGEVLGAETESQSSLKGRRTRRNEDVS